MATVRAFQLSGLKIWFWSNDHEPPHFHVMRPGEWEVKVHFLLQPSQMIEFEWCEKKPSNKVLKEITSLAEEHRVALFQQWEEIHEN